MVNLCEVDEASAAGSLPIVENSGPKKLDVYLALINFLTLNFPLAPSLFP